MKIIDQIKIDKRSNYSNSYQLISKCYDLMLKNILKVKDVMPSINDLANALDIDEKDVQIAYHYLIDKHYLREENNQFIVSYLEMSSDLFSNITTIDSSIERMGLHSSHIVVTAKRTKFPKDLVNDTTYGANEPVFLIERVFYGNDIPMIYIQNYISLSILKDFDKIYENHFMVNNLFEDYYHINILHSKRRIKVTTLPNKIAKFLNDKIGSAAFLTKSLMYNEENELINYSELWTTSHYAFTIKSDL